MDKFFAALYIGTVFIISKEEGLSQGEIGWKRASVLITDSWIFGSPNPRARLPATNPLIQTNLS